MSDQEWTELKLSPVQAKCLSKGLNKLMSLRLEKQEAKSFLVIMDSLFKQKQKWREAKIDEG